MRSQARYSWFALIALFWLVPGVVAYKACLASVAVRAVAAVWEHLVAIEPVLAGCGDTYVDEWVSEAPCVDEMLCR